MYNKKIIELNAELQTIPERCPFEVATMCDMVSSNRLQAENFTYLVSEYCTVYGPNIML